MKVNKHVVTLHVVTNCNDKKKKYNYTLLIMYHRAPKEPNVPSMSPAVRVTFRAFLRGDLLLSATFLLCIYIIRCYYFDL